MHLLANENFYEREIKEKLVQISQDRCFKEFQAFYSATKKRFYSEKKAKLLLVKCLMFIITTLLVLAHIYTTLELHFHVLHVHFIHH